MGELACEVDPSRRPAPAVITENVTPARSYRWISGETEQRPSWNRESRTLFFQGKPIKNFTKAAPKQFLMLDAFEELGWPNKIDDPLPGSDNPVQNRANTVASLNYRAIARSFLVSLDCRSSGGRFRK